MPGASDAYWQPGRAVRASVISMAKVFSSGAWRLGDVADHCLAEPAPSTLNYWPGIPHFLPGLLACSCFPVLRALNCCTGFRLTAIQCVGAGYFVSLARCRPPDVAVRIFSCAFAMFLECRARSIFCATMAVQDRWCTRRLARANLKKLQSHTTRMLHHTQ